MLFSRKNVVDITFGVLDKGLDKLVGLPCGVCRSFDCNDTTAGRLLSIGINIDMRSSCFTDGIDITSSTTNYTTNY